MVLHVCSSLSTLVPDLVHRLRAPRQNSAMGAWKNGVFPFVPPRENCTRAPWDRGGKSTGGGGRERGDIQGGESWEIVQFFAIEKAHRWEPPRKAAGTGSTRYGKREIQTPWPAWAPSVDIAMGSWHRLITVTWSYIPTTRSWHLLVSFVTFKISDEYPCHFGGPPRGSMFPCSQQNFLVFPCSLKASFFFILVFPVP